MDLPKDRTLDNLCRRLAQTRATMNEAKESEDADKAAALARMTEKGIQSYTRHGVELIHTTTDKLRVRLVDDQKGDSGGEGGEE
jgi:hypothetical protein